MRHVHNTFLTRYTVTLHNTIRRPQISHNRITRIHNLRQHRQVVIRVPCTIIFTIRHRVLPTISSNRRVNRPNISTPKQNHRFNKVQAIKRLVRFITRNRPPRHQLLNRLPMRFNSRHFLHLSYVNVLRRITTVPNGRP